MSLLDVASRRPTVSSAVAFVRTSGVKPTGIFRARHSAMSIWSYPTDIVPIHFSWGPTGNEEKGETKLDVFVQNSDINISNTCNFFF
jgi:hypothetical protein